MVTWIASWSTICRFGLRTASRIIFLIFITAHHKQSVMHLITRLVLDLIKARPGQFLYPDVMIQMNTKCPHTNIYSRGPASDQCNYNRGARIQMVATNNHWTLSRGWAGLQVGLVPIKLVGTRMPHQCSHQLGLDSHH